MTEREKHLSDSIGNLPEIGKKAGQTWQLNPYPCSNPACRWEGGALGEEHVRFLPWFLTCAYKVLTFLCCAPACPPPKRNRKNQIEESGHFPFPKSSPRPIFKHINKATLRYAQSSNVCYPLKGSKFFLLLDPHHHINIAVVHQCWAKKPCQGLSEEVCSCQKENMDNLFAVVSLFFFLQRWDQPATNSCKFKHPSIKKKGQSDIDRWRGLPNLQS